MNVTIDSGRCAVVLVDYQQRLLPAIRGGSVVVSEAERLADCARALGIRVIGTEQNPDGLGPNASGIRKRCEITHAKMHFDGCEDGLAEVLRVHGQPAPTDIVIAGCETHVCLLQTAVGLLAAGLRVFVVADACGSRSPRDHAAALERLRAAGAAIVTLEMVVFEWLQTCDHLKFREALGLVKEKPAGTEFRWDDASPG